MNVFLTYAQGYKSWAKRQRVEWFETRTTQNHKTTYMLTYGKSVSILHACKIYSKWIKIIAQYVLTHSGLMNVRGTTNRFIDRNMHKQVVADLSRRLITTLHSAQQSQSDWCTNIHIAGLQHYLREHYKLNEESDILVSNVVTRIICLNPNTHKTQMTKT